MTHKLSASWRPRYIGCLVALFLLALLPRLYSAQTLGWDWDAPNSFTLINFDEAGSCRAALEGFDYSTFIGRQTIFIADILGLGPEPGITGDEASVKAYCHSAGHIQVARSYSAVVGSLTVVLLVVIGLLLVPSQPAIAWTAGALLAVSGFHISESHSGTVDAPSVFFIYAFLTLMVLYAIRGSRTWLFGSLVLLVPAIWTKYWVFAIFAYLSLIPLRLWEYATTGMTTGRIVLAVVATAVLMGVLTNSAFQASGAYILLPLYYLVIPWRRINRVMVAFWLLVPVVLYWLSQLDLVYQYTTGAAEGGFGSGYAAIGWNKWLRNLVNIPWMLIVGLGIPACLFIPAGIRFLLTSAENSRAWTCLMPVAAFALFMAFLAPVTYYRHYLALLPAAALLSACGLYDTSWARKRWFLVIYFTWPALLAADFVTDYHQDPRRELRPWFKEHTGKRVFVSYYVSPPNWAGQNYRLFTPEFAEGDALGLRQAHYLILSENWYDTAFANELNGPLVSNPERLIKTKPEYVRFYRAALEERHPHLVLEQSYDVGNFMPELLIHKWLYGTFQLFVGDIKIYRIVD